MVLRIAYNAADVIWPSCDGIVATHGPNALYIWMQPNFGLIVGNCANILEEIPKCNLIYVWKYRSLLLISFHLKFFHTFLQNFFLNLKLINFHGCKSDCFKLPRKLILKLHNLFCWTSPPHFTHVQEILKGFEVFLLS